MASLLTRRGVSPNAISSMSVVFATLAGALLVSTAYSSGMAIRICWALAALCVQLRLLMNMLDGMVAIQSGKGSPVGELFNEIPDRISDPLILIGAGYAAGGDVALGFGAAVVALFVAYVRAMGALVGAGQLFVGPMAKPHRMAAVTVVCVYSAAAPISWQPVHVATGWGPTAWVLLLIIVGGLLTAIRRLRRIAAKLREKR